MITSEEIKTPEFLAELRRKLTEEPGKWHYNEFVLVALLDKIERLQAEIVGEGKVLAQNVELMTLCESQQKRIAELEAEQRRVR